MADPEETRTVHLTFTAEFTEDLEVPVDWEWDNELDSLLEFTDMEYNSGFLTDWQVTG